MTSKNLFFNLMREDAKRKFGAFIGVSLALFILFPLYTMLRLEGKSLTVQEIFSDIISLQNVGIVLVTLAAALLFAMQGFGYLQSKKQVDFYHSIPVKREVLFLTRYVNGALGYLIPFYLFAALSLIIGGTMGAWSANTLQRFGWMLLVTSLFYLLNYTVMIIGIILTGNKVISVVMMALLNFYIPLILLLKDLLCQTYFMTFWNQVTGKLENLLIRISPIIFYGKFIQLTDNPYIRQREEQNILLMVILVIVETLLLLVAAMKLYQSRNSESVGKAIAFPKLEVILKILLVAPLSFLGGIFFQSLSYNSSLNWFLIGLILSYLLVSAGIEVLFAFDFRQAFAHKKMWLINMVLILIIGFTFVMDLFGYETYLPKQEEIASIEIGIDGFMGFEKYGRNYTIESENIEQSYPLVSDAVEQIRQTNRLEFLKSGGDTTVVQEQLAQHENKGMVRSMSVQYRLKNGKKVIRTYTIDIAQEKESITAFYENQSYNLSNYEENTAGHSLQIRYENGTTDNYIYANEGTVDEDTMDRMGVPIPLSAEQVTELLDIYWEEMQHYTLACTKQMIPIGVIRVAEAHRYEEGVEYTQNSSFLYPFCTKTIAYLQEATNQQLVIGDEIKPEEIVNATMRIQDDSFTIPLGENEKMHLQSILDVGIPAVVETTNAFWELELDDQIDVELTHRTDEYGNINITRLRFRQGEVPAYLTQLVAERNK
ncbi:MAG: DUF6449 domain-containing protein [Lachnospiraceae bacterium]